MKKILAVILIIIGISMAAFPSGNQSGAKRSEKAVNQSIVFKGYPIDAKNQTIRWFVSEGYLPNMIYASVDQSPFHQGLKEMLGVNIDWQFPSRGEDTRQALNLALASGDLPDIIFGQIMADAERYLNEGTFRDLTPYIQLWSPAYWKWIHTNPAYDRAMKTDSGKYYGYGFFREAGGWNDTNLGPVVNKAWLDECSLALPKTISDWDKVLRTFKQKYGVAMSFAWSQVSGYGTGISGAWGAHSFADYRLYVDNNKKIQLANVQPEYRNQLQKWAEWWRDGLIDKNFLSNNDIMARSNALNKRMGISITSADQLSIWAADADKAKTGANWIGLQYPKGDNGTLVQVTGGYGIGEAAAAITTACKPEKLELAMRAMDYAYTDDGNLYWNFGKKGVSWDYGSDGRPAYLPLITNTPGGINDAIDKYCGSAWSGNCIQASLLIKLKTTKQAIDAIDLWYYPNEKITYLDKLPYSMTFTAQESSRAIELRTAIQAYVDESTIQFITGQASFSTWDNYVARVSSMGLSELLGIYQTAYDRYMKR